MEKQELYETWAPPGGAWSPWAKPVLFAHYPRPLPALAPFLQHDLGWVPPPSERCAIVVELPNAEAVETGLALAERGYRPVPLFNACPPPLGFEPIPQTPGSSAWLALVFVDSILAALIQGAERLRSLTIPADAPPAFLIDANRQTPWRQVQPGAFDNRSVHFVTDFPSARFLASKGIHRALLIQAAGRPLRGDLANVLRTWQKAGVTLTCKRLNEPGPPQPLTIGGMWLLYNFWQRVATFLTLRRNPLGGFGDFIPEGSSGG